MVDTVEDFLYSLGFQNVRARHQKNTLKIEVNPEDIKKFFQDEIRVKVIEKAKKSGYTYVTVDIEGYRQGSLNEVFED